MLKSLKLKSTFTNYLIAFSILTFGTVPAARAEVLANGGFDATLSPWVASGDISAGLTSAAIIGFNTSFGSASGTLSQSFTLASSGLFDYAFKAGRSESFCGCDDVSLTFSITVDGIELSSVLPAFDGAGSQSVLALNLNGNYAGTVALGAGTHEFAFHFSRGGSLFGRSPYFGIDGVSLVQQQVGAVPELSTWAMMLLGFAGLGYGACRRTSKRASVAA